MPEWSRIIGETIVIENRGGAGGTIGAEMVTRARPDGYTLLLFPTAIFTISPTMMRPPYDVDRDFAPIARVAASDAFVVVNPSVPARTIQELVAYGGAPRAAALRVRRQRHHHPAAMRDLRREGGRQAGTRSLSRLGPVGERPGRGAHPDDLRPGRAADGARGKAARAGEFRRSAPSRVPRRADADGSRAWRIAARCRGSASLHRPATPLAVRARIAASLEEALEMSEQVARGMAIGGLRPAFETGEAFANRITQDRAIFAEVIRRTGAGVN